MLSETHPPCPVSDHLSARGIPVSFKRAPFSTGLRSTSCYRIEKNYSFGKGGSRNPFLADRTDIVSPACNCYSGPSAREKGSRRGDRSREVEKSVADLINRTCKVRISRNGTIFRKFSSSRFFEVSRFREIWKILPVKIRSKKKIESSRREESSSL